MRLHKLAALVWLGASSSWAATIANMQYISEVGGSGVFTFSVDGVETQLLCVQFFPNATTSPYQANVSTLADLSASTLGLQLDPNALFKYERVAILGLQVLDNPALAADVVRANRYIVDGDGPLTPEQQALLNFAMAANAGDYDLSGFRIYTNVTTQELTGFVDDFDLDAVPEPSTMVLFGSGLVAAALFRRKRVPSAT
jgi:hypothetical protein